jgi:hypothetical protein
MFSPLTRSTFATTIAYAALMVTPDQSPGIQCKSATRRDSRANIRWRQEEPYRFLS